MCYFLFTYKYGSTYQMAFKLLKVRSIKNANNLLIASDSYLVNETPIQKE